MVSGAASINPVSKPLKGKILTFTQSDKEALLSRGYADVHTVHEVQGETYADVSLVRLTPTPVSIIARDSPHVLQYMDIFLLIHVFPYVLKSKKVIYHSKNTFHQLHFQVHLSIF